MLKNPLEAWLQSLYSVYLSVAALLNICLAWSLLAQPDSLSIVSHGVPLANARLWGVLFLVSSIFVFMSLWRPDLIYFRTFVIATLITVQTAWTATVIVVTITAHLPFVTIVFWLYILFCDFFATLVVNPRRDAPTIGMASAVLLRSASRFPRNVLRFARKLQPPINMEGEDDEAQDEAPKTP